jgi:hypothetical protein
VSGAFVGKNGLDDLTGSHIDGIRSPCVWLKDRHLETVIFASILGARASGYTTHRLF